MDVDRRPAWREPLLALLIACGVAAALLIDSSVESRVQESMALATPGPDTVAGGRPTATDHSPTSTKPPQAATSGSALTSLTNP